MAGKLDSLLEPGKLSDSALPACQQQPSCSQGPSCWNPHWTIRAIAFLAFSAAIMQLYGISEYMVERACHDLYNASCGALTHHEHERANSHAASISTFTTSLPAGISLITTVYLAVLGDYKGRKQFLVFTLGAMLLGQIVLLTAAALDLPVWTFVIGTGVTSIGGTVPAMTAMLFAHTADLTTHADRAVTFAYLEASTMIAAACGCLSLGYLSRMGSAAPFIGVVSLSGSAFMLCCLFFPEIDNSEPASQVVPGWCDIMKRNVQLMASKEIFKSKNHDINCSPRFLSVMILPLMAGKLGVVTLVVTYLKSSTFGLTNTEVGYLTAAQSIISWICLAALVPLIQKLFPQTTEVVMMRLGSIVLSVCIAGYAVAPSVTVIVPCMMMQSLDVLVSPAIRTLFSLVVKPDQQGTAGAVYASLESLVMLTVPIAMGQVYRAVNHRLPFLILAGVSLSFFCLALTVKARTLVRVRRRSIIDEKFVDSPCASGGSCKSSEPSSRTLAAYHNTIVVEKIGCEDNYDLISDVLAFDPIDVQIAENDKLHSDV